MLQSDPLAALQLEVDLDLAQLVAAVVAATAVEGCGIDVYSASLVQVSYKAG